MTPFLRFLRSMAGPRLCIPFLCWFFTLGILWPSTLVLAQGNPDALRNRLNYIFQPLDKSQVPTGFLAEYGIRLVDPEAYTGTVSSDNRVDMSVWRMLYISLYSSRIYGTNPLSTITTVNNSIKSYASSPISIPILHLNYAGLRTDALTANLLRVQNDQLFDVAGRPSSPYVNKTAFAAAPVKAYADQGNVQFILRSALFYTNTGKTLSSTQINFSDGRGYVTVSWNTPLSVNYTSIGTKTLYIKLRYTDGTSVECRTDFLVRELISAVARYGNTADLEQPFTGNANHSGGRVFVRYSVTNATRTTTNPRIIRPLIVAEPFDASSVAPSVQENFTYATFIRRINEQPGTYDFNFQLDDIGGYDLVFVDYTNGTDDIRRNAALLQEIIVWVNSRKPTSGTQQQNVILGMSMGGLVARYALANMEKQRRTSPTTQNNHQTRLLITHDSPHRGANVPLGVQYLARSIGKVVINFGSTVVGNVLVGDVAQSLQETLNLLDAPASQQMLVLRGIYNNGLTSQNNTFLNNEYRTMITFPTSAPPPYRMVATSDGAECGTPVLNPYAPLLNLNGSFFFSPLPFIIKTKWKTEFIINALPQQQSMQVYKGKIWIDYKILSVINATATVWEQTGNSPSTALAWDGAPGGTRPIREEIGEFPDVDVNFWIFFGARLNGFFANEFCFVPTASALDVTTINAAALTAQYTGGSNPANPSRFVNFITQRREGNQFNETHVQFTASLSEWIFDEMQNRNPIASCIQFCSLNSNITPTTATVCTVNSTFNLQNVPGGVAVTWAVTPAGSFTPSTGTGTTATFKAKTNNPGTGTLTYTLNSACGTHTVSRNFNINMSPVRMPQTTYPGPYATIYAEVDPVPGATSYEWYLNGLFQQISSYNHEFVVDDCGDYSTSVRVNTPTCGWSGLSTIYFSVVCSGFFAIYPNPADEQLNVELVSDNDTTSTMSSPELNLAAQNAFIESSDQPTEEFSVILYNGQQEVVATGVSENQKLSLDASNLPTGTYFLHIHYKGDVAQKQVLIE